MHKSKEPSVVIKLDYEKTYDKVNLDFLLDILKARGFGEKMRGWIKNIVFGGSVSVLANGEESATFKTSKGLRQGDPLSPLLFNLVVDALTKMLSKAIGKGLVRGLLDQFRSEAGRTVC
jgi:acylphosphatase